MKISSGTMQAEIPMAVKGEIKPPNARLPPVSLRDKGAAVGQLLSVVPTVLFSLFRRRAFRRSALPLREDIKRTLIRSCAGLPLSILMRMIKSDKPEAIFQATRFRNTKAHFGIPVSTAHFSGYWLVKQPSDSRISGRRRVVMLWIHGGAYCVGDEFAGLGSLLRLAELATDRGIDLDIFSLEYTLAPEARFPVQQQQAVSAYRFLLEQQQVDPECIIVGGESAGGHLAIACLQGIARAHLPRPKGSLLLCPWVNMTNTAASFERNKCNDILVKDSLDRCAALALGPDASQDCRNLLNFCVPSTGDLQWANILPPRTWMNVGSHDLFIDDIISFQTIMAAEGLDIVLSITEGKTHGWQAMADNTSSKTYFNLAPGEALPPGCMPGSANMLLGLSWLLGSQ
ncbi:uncharacterized protein DSM5745_00789 [Aspergillus mulundensis]|uniref:Alpha/beta hydrolase fold-3 domain-containing protein n=1 Tax=Aspergillus mulundensis TaxID=1810919 RepID=A0A3D8T4H2_9EURO|nr:hypothetical protein DSM5745_00789 [Aspergillus mulundensis]RDW93467.1 hypothetical protein DSM5745_00789 [Aspergillus mulundensis]